MTELIINNSDQLEKDGNLRKDISIEVERPPETWEDVKAGIRATLHPELESSTPGLPKSVGKNNSDDTST